jgi:hypothetical protein
MTKAQVLKRLDVLLKRQRSDAITERNRSTGPRILWAQDHEKNAEALEVAIKLLQAAP